MARAQPVKPVQLLPAPEGVDTLHGVDTSVFQPGRKEGRLTIPARLATAVNVNIDADGHPTVRRGTTEIISAAAGMNAYSGAGLFLMQDGADIKTVEPSVPSATTIETLPSAVLKAHMHEQAGSVFVSNGTTHRVVTSAGVSVNWGMVVPPVATLGITAGDLPAGRYRVACRLVDGSGVLSAAPKAAVVTVDGTKDINVDLSSYDANATRVRIYVSHTDGKTMYFAAEVAVGSLPETIGDIKHSSERLKCQFMIGPQGLPGIAGISSWRGFMLVWRDTGVMHSYGNQHHIFDVGKAVWRFPSTVRAAVGAGDVCWIATDRGMFNYIGMPPDGALSDPIGTRAYAEGFSTVDAGKIPMLEGVTGRVAVFASDSGIALGLPDGRLMHPQEDRVRWDVAGKTASIDYVETDDDLIFIVDLE